ncbi:hypothetical protein RB595_005751 [Gaeumannomyces hyphopodioides]
MLIDQWTSSCYCQRECDGYIKGTLSRLCKATIRDIINDLNTSFLPATFYYSSILCEAVQPFQSHTSNPLASPAYLPIIAMSSQKASTCCGKSDVCVCGKSPLWPCQPLKDATDMSCAPCPATQAKCSCGKQSALHCTCEKAATENSVSGARCSCRARPAGECNCERAGSENVRPTGSACACGSRPADACTCEKGGASGVYDPANETDFTTKK